MASTYSNSGIELIADGEQTGTWGDTTNTNLQIIDRMVNGVGAISLSGTTHTLTTSDGTLSDGHYSVLVFGGSPSGTNTVTLSPSNASHLYVVKNSSGQSVVMTQGSGGNVTIPNGKSAVVYANGGGAGAAVVDVTSTISLAANSIGASELNVSGNGTTSQFLRSDGDGSFTWATPTNTTYSAGNGISLSGTTFSVAAGGGLTQDASGLSHSDTSTQASVDNSGATVIQDVTLDTYGHVTALGSVTLTAASVGALATGGKAADSNLLDGIDSASFLRSDAADQKTSGTLRFNDNVILSLGTGDDAEFFCDGAHFYLDLNAGIGNFYIRDGTTTRFTFDDAGDFTATGNVTAYSDERLKSNIQTIANAVDTVKALRGVTFEKDGKASLGVIAQEVQKVLPELVHEGDEYLSVAYGNMVGVLIEAIKEQQKQIDELKAKLEG